MTSSTGQIDHSLLALLFDNLSAAAFSVATTEAVYAVLSAKPEIGAVRHGLANGSITEQQIATFVEKLQRRFKVGERFLGDVAFCALAIALEKRQTTFAKTFLEKLASLNIQELPFSARIARLALQERAKQLGGLTSKTIEISSPVGAASSLLIVSNPHRVASSRSNLPDGCYAT